jgi:hypothetical protein
MNYSVIIGVYDRLKWRDHIIKAVKAQTLLPIDITVWVNKNPIKKFDLDFESQVWQDVKFIYATENYGVYARFSAALYAKTDWVMVLDDDTIPALGWASNCVRTIETVGENSIIGYRGIRLKKDTLYDIEAYEKGTKEITEVDLCGHSWFCHKNHILTMFEEAPVNSFNGEDTHLSACNQIKYKTKTYIPAQPLDHPETWGSTKQFLGAQPGRLSTTLGSTSHLMQRQQVNKHWLEKGWKIYDDKS